MFKVLSQSWSILRREAARRYPTEKIVYMAQYREKATSYLMCNDHTQIANSARLSLPFSTCLLLHTGAIWPREKPTLFGNVIGLGNESVLWIRFTFPFFVGLLDNTTFRQFTITNFDVLTQNGEGRFRRLTDKNCRTILDSQSQHDDSILHQNSRVVQ